MSQRGSCDICISKLYLHNYWCGYLRPLIIVVIMHPHHRHLRHPLPSSVVFSLFCRLRRLRRLILTFFFFVSSSSSSLLPSFLIAYLLHRPLPRLLFLFIFILFDLLHLRLLPFFFVFPFFYTLPSDPSVLHSSSAVFCFSSMSSQPPVFTFWFAFRTAI